MSIQVFGDVTEWSYGPNVVLDPRTSDTIQRSVTYKVFASDGVTELTPLDALGNPINTPRTSNDGLIIGFKIPVAQNPDGTARIKLPGIDQMFAIYPANFGVAVGAIRSVLEQVDGLVHTAETAAESASSAQLAASQAAAQIEGSQIGQFLGPDGKIPADRISGNVAAKLTYGVEPGRSWISPEEGVQLEFLAPGSVEQQIRAAGSTQVTPGSLVARDGSGKVQAADPVDPSDVATRRWVETLLAANQALAAELTATPKWARWNGTAFTVNGRPLTNRSDGRPIMFWGGPQPQTVGTFSVLPGDVHLVAAQ